MEKLLNQNKQWIDETWEKIDEKLKKVVARNKYIIAGYTENGKYKDCSKEAGIGNWTNGYWPGIMWLMYDATGDVNYREVAEYGEKALDMAQAKYDILHHDVGFMWLLSSVANHTITGNAESRNRALHAACILAARYNVNGGYIGAWQGPRTSNWVIIDCMMNIQLLFWAYQQTGNLSFKSIAMSHADTCMRDHIREDGSVNHCIEYDGNTGEVLGKPFTQGYDMDSSWTRGQGWAVYGYVMSYLHTGEKRYLDAAKKVAHYFIAASCCDGYIPKADFVQPDDQIDTSAAAVVACGLIEIAKAVPERESKMYLKAAFNLLKALTESQCDWTDNNDAILQNCSGCWNKQVHIPAMYGEYYFVEAMYKLKGFGKILSAAM